MRHLLWRLNLRNCSDPRPALEPEAALAIVMLTAGRSPQCWPTQSADQRLSAPGRPSASW